MSIPKTDKVRPQFGIGGKISLELNLNKQYLVGVAVSQVPVSSRVKV